MLRFQKGGRRQVDDIKTVRFANLALARQNQNHLAEPDHDPRRLVSPAFRLLGLRSLRCDALGTIDALTATSRNVARPNVRYGVKHVILRLRRSLPVFADKRTITEPVGTSDLTHVAAGFFIRPLPRHSVHFGG